MYQVVKHVTVDWLKDIESCESGVRMFQKVFGDEADLLIDRNLYEMAQFVEDNTSENSYEVQFASNVQWLIQGVAAENEKLLHDIAASHELFYKGFYVRAGVKQPPGYSLSIEYQDDRGVYYCLYRDLSSSSKSISSTGLSSVVATFLPFA
jgi:hypothetical protein